MRHALVAGLLGLMSVGAPASDKPLTPIESIDVQRYMGTWY